MDEFANLLAVTSDKGLLIKKNIYVSQTFVFA